MPSINIFASILAALGLVFIGIKQITANLGQLAGRGLRQWVARSTGSYPASALLGLLAGAVTQSTNAITVILMSLATADIITLSQAAPILAWANVGTSVLVLAVAIDFHLFVLVITAVAGLCYYVNLDRSPRWRPIVSALFAVCLLFLGLELLRSGTHELSAIDWVRNFFVLAERWDISAFLVGGVLAVIAQSSATVTVIAIAMASAGLLSLEQSMATVFGASVGSGLSTYIVSSGVNGTARQLPIFQAAVKILGVAVLLPLFLAERAFDVPLLAHAIRFLIHDPSKQVAFVYVICQIAAVGVQVLFNRPLQLLAQRWAPASLEEATSKPRYIYDQALSEPETALALVDREQARVFGLLLVHLGVTDHLDRGEAVPARGAVLSAATALDHAIAHFLTDLADTGAARDVLEMVANRQARNSLLQSIHESLDELGETASRPFEIAAMQSLCTNLLEGLAALLMVAEDAVRSCDADNLLLLRQMTADRDSLVDQMRRRVIAADKMLSAHDQRTLYTITSLFERVVWMLRRYGALLAAPATIPEEQLAAHVESRTAPLSQAGN
jgi:phosphate:Na+ symporter